MPREDARNSMGAGWFLIGRKEGTCLFLFSLGSSSKLHRSVLKRLRE